MTKPIRRPRCVLITGPNGAGNQRIEPARLEEPGEAIADVSKTCPGHAVTPTPFPASALPRVSQNLPL
jgi:hypothetical protein